MTQEDAGDAALATIRVHHICGSAAKINNNFNITRIYIHISSLKNGRVSWSVRWIVKVPYPDRLSIIFKMGMNYIFFTSHIANNSPFFPLGDFRVSESILPHPLPSTKVNNSPWPPPFCGQISDRCSGSLVATFAKIDPCVRFTIVVISKDFPLVPIRN